MLHHCGSLELKIVSTFALSPLKARPLHGLKSSESKDTTAFKRPKFHHVSCDSKINFLKGPTKTRRNTQVCHLVDLDACGTRTPLYRWCSQLLNNLSIPYCMILHPVMQPIKWVQSLAPEWKHKKQKRIWITINYHIHRIHWFMLILTPANMTCLHIGMPSVKRPSVIMMAGEWRSEDTAPVSLYIHQMVWPVLTCSALCKGSVTSKMAHPNSNFPFTSLHQKRGLLPRGKRHCLSFTATLCPSPWPFHRVQATTALLRGAHEAAKA